MFNNFLEPAVVDKVVALLLAAAGGVAGLDVAVAAVVKVPGVVGCVPAAALDMGSRDNCHQKIALTKISIIYRISAPAS